MAKYEVPQETIKHILTDPQYDLSPWCLEELAKSGITEATARAHQLRCLPAGKAGIGLLTHKILNLPYGVPGQCLLFPYKCYGEVVLPRVKPEHPYNGAKYLSPKDSTPRAYFTEHTQGWLMSEKPDRVFDTTEGEKKAQALWQCGRKAIGLAGVDTWHKPGSNYVLNSDLQAGNWKGATVYIVFDSDVWRNENSITQLKHFAAALEKRGAIAHIVVLRDTADDPKDPIGSKVGIDDYILKHGPDAVKTLLESEANWSPPDKPHLSSQNMEDVTKKYYEQLPHPLVYHKRQFYSCNPTPSQWELEDIEQVEKNIYGYVTQEYQRIEDKNIKEVRKQLINLVGVSCSESPCWRDGEAPAGFDNPQANGLILKDDLLNLETKATTPNTPNLFTPYRMDVPYKPNAPKPERCLKLLRETFGDEDQIRLLLQHMGRSLTATMPLRNGRKSLQHILMILGFPGSGKGTIMRIWELLLGSQNVASLSLADFNKQFGAYQLLGKQLIVIPDIRSANAFNGIALERLCNISGEDSITIEPKWGHAFSTRVYGKLVLVGNVLPRFDDPSGSLCRRLHILQTLPPDEKAPRIDKLSEQIFAAEASGILNLAIEAWRDVCENGFIEPSKKSLALLQEQRELDSNLASYLEECCDLDPSYRVKQSAVLNDYDTWCWRNNHKPMGHSKLSSELRSVVPHFAQERPRDQGVPIRYYVGLRLKPSGVPQHMEGTSEGLNELVRTAKGKSKLLHRSRGF